MKRSRLEDSLRSLAFALTLSTALSVALVLAVARGCV